MARKKSAPEASTETDNDRLDWLTVNNLAQEIRVLREAVDELRELLEWAMQNREAPASSHPFFPVAGVARDAADIEPGEISPPTPDHQPDEHEEEEPSVAAPGQLF